MCAHSDVTPLVHDHTCTSVSFCHGCARRRVRDAAPQVDDRKAAEHHAHRSADLAALGEVAHELVAHALEGRVPEAGDRAARLPAERRRSASSWPAPPRRRCAPAAAAGRARPPPAAAPISSPRRETPVACSSLPLVDSRRSAAWDPPETSCEICLTVRCLAESSQRCQGDFRCRDDAAGGTPPRGRGPPRAGARGSGATASPSRGAASSRGARQPGAARGRARHLAGHRLPPLRQRRAARRRGDREPRRGHVPPRGARGARARRRARARPR